MNSTFKSAEALVGDKVRAIYAIWEALKGPRLAPERKEITLAQVRALSPWMWIIDIIDDGADFRFRLAGDRIVQFLGGRDSGAAFSELPPNPFYERMRHTLQHSLENKSAVAVGPVRSNYPGKEHWETEIVVLPLSDDGAKITALFGAMELWPVGSGAVRS